MIVVYFIKLEKKGLLKIGVSIVMIKYMLRYLLVVFIIGIIDSIGYW